MIVDAAVKRFLRSTDYKIYRISSRLKNSGFSNFDEEAILKRYVTALLPENNSRTAVDIGASDGKRGSNTLFFFRDGWNGLGIESDSRKVCKLAKTYKHLPGVSACRFRVTPFNVVPLLEAYGVEYRFGILSLDIDGYDYWILDSILANFRPTLIVTEINETIPPPIRFRVNYSPELRARGHFFGYSIQSLEDLCKKYVYALVELEYNNAFIVPNEMAKGSALTAEVAYQRGYLNRSDRKAKFSSNEDVEVLHSLSPDDSVKFINQLFSHEQGRYDIGVVETQKVEATQRMNAP